MHGQGLRPEGLCTPGAVNIGDALMRWSDDKLKSNYHRVRMPVPGEDQGSRYSIAYFNQAGHTSPAKRTTYSSDAVALWPWQLCTALGDWCLWSLMYHRDSFPKRPHPLLWAIGPGVLSGCLKCAAWAALCSGFVILTCTAVRLLTGVVLIVSCAVQANKSAVIAGKEGRYPAITAEEFVRESLAAIYVKQEE